MTEYAWLIESGDSQVSAPLYYAGYNELKSKSCWSYTLDDAIRFSRKADAEKVSRLMKQQNNRIAEHGWGLGESK